MVRTYVENRTNPRLERDRLPDIMVHLGRKALELFLILSSLGREI